MSVEALAKTLKGIRLRNRPAEISLFLSSRAGDWGDPVIDHAALENTADWQELPFPPKDARFLRLLTHREVADRPFASLAEIQPIPATP